MVWLPRKGSRIYGLAARESLFDAIALQPRDLVQVGEAGMLRMFVAALAHGGVVRIDNDPPMPEQP